MNVRGERSTDGDLVDPGLLLTNGPGRPLPILILMKVLDELGPHDAAFDFDQSVDAIEFNHGVVLLHVKQHRAGTELLATHRVPATGDGNRNIQQHGLLQGLMDLHLRTGHHDGVDLGSIHTRLDIIDFGHGCYLRKSDRSCGHRDQYRILTCRQLRVSVALRQTTRFAVLPAYDVRRS